MDGKKHLIAANQPRFENQAECICKTDIKTETIIVGFPGHGLVGSIAAKYIVQVLELEVVGYIRSPLIPPLAVFMDGILAYPYRIFGKKDCNISVLIGESPAPVSAYYHLANAALDWSTEHAKAKEIICLDGFPDSTSTEGENTVYLVAEPDMKEKITEIDLPLPQTGYIGGLSGAILNEAIIREVNGFALLAGTVSQLPDPIGAAALVKIINKLKNTDIDVSKLLDDGNRIKQSLKEFAAKTRQISEIGRPSDQPSLYT